jgi:hypothetical protein
VIVNQHNDYSQLVERMNREAYISTPIFRDIHKHHASNTILCVGITFLDGEFYVVSVSHKDAPQFALTTHNHFNVELMAYLTNGHVDEMQVTPYIQETHNLFRNLNDCNRIIPLTQWSTTLRTYNEKVLAFVQKHLDVVTTPTYQFMQMAIDTLRRIEYAGLAVDVPALDTYFENKSKRFVTDGKVYSQYYPYTTTGRPSNRFGGINFAALNKHDGSRAAFVSRFRDGVLLQLDFESYHLRLIADVMNVQLPNEPIHQYLAKQYFGKDTISQEEYDEGKQITFGILYGADIETDIPLLHSIKELSKTIYKNYQIDGLRAPISGRQIYLPENDATENKLFNYFVQNYEFESTVPRLKELLDYLNTKQSKLVLYTYDAVLIDCHPDELTEIQAHAYAILGANKYPLRSYIGSNYNELKEIVSME